MDFYSSIMLPTAASLTCEEIIRCKVCFICLLLLPSTPMPTLPQKQYIQWSRSSFQSTNHPSTGGLIVSPGFSSRHVYQPIEIDVALGSVVHFQCPELAENEHYLVYKVSAEDYESCSTENTRRKRASPFLRCTGSAKSGGRAHRRTLQISELNPFGRGYKAGQQVHFISTSSGSPLGIDNMHDGACVKHQMKVKLTVKKAEHPEERYRSCLKILGVQPECCEPRDRLSDICAAHQAPTTLPPQPEASLVSGHAGFFLSQGPPNGAMVPTSNLLDSVFSAVVTSLVTRLIRRKLFS